MINEGERLAAMDPLDAAAAEALAAAVQSGRLNLPRPGGGRTRERWAILAVLAAEDHFLARLSEGHTDALAILAEPDLLAEVYIRTEGTPASVAHATGLV